MGPFILADSTRYFPEHSPHHQVPVKTEASASPDLLPPSIASLQQFQFKFHAPPSSSSHGSLPSSRHPSEPPAPTSNHAYPFSSGSSYNLVSTQSSWPPSPSASHRILSCSSRSSMINGSSQFDRPASQHSMSYEDYDDVSELVDLPIPPLSGGARADATSASSVNGSGKHIRRRSSKACDQCRKSKCKCERSGPGEPCKSCVMLGTPCTFLGPSRKRGPPKGYIDAIEARLHQTEALLGIMLSASDARAQTLLRDISKDPLAREIINRVDNSPYGVKGRKRNEADGKPRAGHQASNSDSSLSMSQKTESPNVDLTSTHPSNEWQDRVSAMLHAARGGDNINTDATVDAQRLRPQSSAPALTTSYSSSRPSLRVSLSVSTSSGLGGINDDQSPARRQRRRVDTEFDADYQRHSYSNNSPPNSAVSQMRGTSPGHLHGYGHGPYSAVSPRDSSMHRWSVSSTDSLSSASDGELMGAVGQLSLNENEQVRYHGKASGLHLLGNKERVDARNEGGIWRFPGARVWPPLSSPGPIPTHDDSDSASQLPDPMVQEHLLDLYFTYVHPVLPIIHKRAFFEAFQAERRDDSHSPEPHEGASPSPFNRRRRRVPPLLLLTMYATAARYSDLTPKPPDSSMMWEAGDDYLNRAKVILEGSYASSLPSTCQALLLMGYREIGIGAMAQAWTYIGMAIRMAQDLGMHRSADGWAREDLGGRLFGDWELHERKRIWFACVIMDKYVSTYIGRPLMIFERDFDTSLPTEDDPEELEEWTPSSIPESGEKPLPVPGRIISCFNASATLSGILSMIVQAIYAIRPVSSRHSESKFLEGLLDKWYIELPEHLRYEPGSSKRPIPTPHVLTLHMQYWCAVLLLHRPFIRQSLYDSRPKNVEESDDVEVRAIAEKSYELCAGAANHITSIAKTYSETYTLDRCAVFLCYYIFTASIMHVTSLTTHPNDPQARMGLSRCMDFLRMMEVVWPSAGRALELLRGSKVNTQEGDFILPSSDIHRRKRSADQPLNDAFDRHLPLDTNVNQDFLELRPPSYNAQFGGHAAYTPSGNIQSHGHGHGPSPSPQVPYIPPYERWPSQNTNSYALSGTLSTSVLPQLYSTGLVDDRGPSGSHRLYSQQDQSRSSHTNRYPQYWNDFSTFPQLGTAYGSYHEQPPVHPQHPAPPQMYLDEPYSLYNPSPSNR